MKAVQAVILAGGMGIRMGEETLVTPKPMLKIGKMPILWHIMKNLYEQGISEFLVLGGYKIEDIREFWRHYTEYVDKCTFYGVTPFYLHGVQELEEWSVGVIDTGNSTLTGGRLRQAIPYIMGDILLTYADGVSDIDLGALFKQARQSDALVTVTATHAPGRFGALCVDKKRKKITDFREKPLSNDLVNGGFWYVKTKAFDYLTDHEMLEMGFIQRLIRDNKADAYVHKGFWHPMDTGRDKDYLTKLWEENKAPWKNWRD